VHEVVDSLNASYGPTFVPSYARRGASILIQPEILLLSLPADKPTHASYWQWRRGTVAGYGCCTGHWNERAGPWYVSQGRFVDHVPIPLICLLVNILPIAVTNCACCAAFAFATILLCRHCNTTIVERSDWIFFIHRASRFPLNFVWKALATGNPCGDVLPRSVRPLTKLRIIVHLIFITAGFIRVQNLTEVCIETLAGDVT